MNTIFNRVRDIIHVLLAECGITRYWLTDLEPENLLLPGSAYYREIEAHSGIVVTPEHAYQFAFSWANDHYTLGKEGRDWQELTSEETIEYTSQRIFQIQQQMHNDPTFGWREPLASPIREAGRSTTREETIIWWWLASSPFFATRDLADYAGPIFEVLDVQSGGHDLVGSLLPGEVQDISGILVIALGVFHFHLSRKPLQPRKPVDEPHPDDLEYSLGANDGSLRSVQREDCTEEQWLYLQMTQQRLEQTFAHIPLYPELLSLADDIAPPGEIPLDIVPLDETPPTTLQLRSGRERRQRARRDLNKNKSTDGTDGE